MVRRNVFGGRTDFQTKNPQKQKPKPDEWTEKGTEGRLGFTEIDREIGRLNGWEFMIQRRTLLLGAAALAVSGGAASAHAADDMTLGAADAPLHLVEYASLTCPHCAHFSETNWTLLKSNYVDTSRVRFTFRELLTPPPQVAFIMFQLARCGGADAAEYMRRVHILFERQAAILGTGTMIGVRDSLFAIGAPWGLSQEQILAAFADPVGNERAHRQIAEANQRGINSTPTFLLNDQLVTDGAFQTPEGMTRILDARLAAR